MPNTVVTSTANSIKVVFNDDSIKVDMDKGTWRKDEIAHIELLSDHIKIQQKQEKSWHVHNSSSNYLIIDSVDGNNPSSLSDLYDKLIALIA